MSPQDQLLLSIELANCHFMASNRKGDMIDTSDLQGHSSLDLSSLSPSVFQVVTTFNMHIQHSCQYLAWIRKSEMDAMLMEELVHQGQVGLRKLEIQSGVLGEMDSKMQDVLHLQVAHESALSHGFNVTRDLLNLISDN